MKNSHQNLEAVSLRTIGIIIGSHGLQGTLKLEPLSDFPERFDALDAVFLLRAGEEAKSYRVKRTRWSGSNVLVELEGILSRDDTAALRGAEMCISEADTWALPPDVYFETDLIGFAGIAEDGATIGILLNILHGAQEILEFERAGENLLVPFVKSWIGRVDCENRTIEILNWRDLIDAESIEPGSSADDD